MKVLVTGAAGLLGRHVVADLVAGGHDVRAIVRPGRDAGALEALPRVEIVRADLRSSRELEAALLGTDAVIHLAAAMTGSDAARFSETVLATERLFDAIDRSRVRRVILCSSFSVYDWLAAHGEVDESLPTSPRIYRSGGYASAKLWQERLAMRRTTQGWQLTILRPGFVWGPGNELPRGSLGPAFGRFQLVLSPLRDLPFTHVVNCARAFRTALENPAAVGAVLNVVDPVPISAWRFAGEAARRSGSRSLRIPVPHLLAWPFVHLATWTARLVLGPSAQLPSVLVPQRFAQGYRPLRYSTARLRGLGWQPPLSQEEALRMSGRSAANAFQ